MVGRRGEMCQTAMWEVGTRLDARLKKYILPQDIGNKGRGRDNLGGEARWVGVLVGRMSGSKKK